MVRRYQPARSEHTFVVSSPVGKRKPTFWAVHTYQTVFREKYGRLQRFLGWSPVKRTGAVWITEVGVYKGYP
jgi:hypothetical protein